MFPLRDENPTARRPVATPLLIAANAFCWARVHTFIFLGFYMTTLAVPAVFMLGYWFVLQVLSGLPALGQAAGGVAFWAHVGGFLAGLALVLPLRRPEYVAAHRAQHARRTSTHRW